jgi:hypothetical protein
MWFHIIGYYELVAVVFFALKLPIAVLILGNQEHLMLYFNWKNFSLSTQKLKIINLSSFRIS